jgi:ABC-type antimicrobial peptide transport system permease subunit
LYEALALSLFSVFMLYNYISTSISRKKRSVGVLRALGAGGKDILLTFLSESVIVAVINGVLANIFAVMGCSFVNSYIVEIMNVSVHFALFGVRQILIISAVSLLTAIISSALPIIKIARKKPVELIRRS